MSSWSPICTTCNKPAHAGYKNIAANEQCCDPCHGPYVVGEAARRFVKFHGRKARKMMAARQVAA